ncbi:MAG TPA: SIR2 family protein [Candidatus Kapabacteria bacterium]|nr:SIR2 family protein [Candidatus Kapabacteria bacterium]
MPFSAPIERFITCFVKDLRNGDAAIFAGAGLSVAAGHVNWTGLFENAAKEIGLDVSKEYDLVSLAQYLENKGHRTRIQQTVIDSFPVTTDPTVTHNILSRLPIKIFWTTNYDNLIEKSLIQNGKVPDVKHEVRQLGYSVSNRHVTVYKMHGDSSRPFEAILTKGQYEKYHRTHLAFLNALTGDLMSKTFLFIGFSFSDPNLNYVLSRLVLQLEGNSREHYCFVKEETGTDPDSAYRKVKQELIIQDLKRYNITCLMIEDYSNIPDILSEIERRINMKSIFISGSAFEYGALGEIKGRQLVHLISAEVFKAGNKIVNGFGLGIGSAVINGALETIFSDPKAYSEENLILRPFPQFETSDKKLPVLWEEYRQQMLSYAGIAIFLFGNKNVGGKVEIANGIIREFEIAHSKGLIPIPVAATGYAARQIFEMIQTEPKKYLGDTDIMPELTQLADETLSIEAIRDGVLSIVNKVNQS